MNCKIHTLSVLLQVIIICIKQYMVEIRRWYYDTQTTFFNYFFLSFCFVITTNYPLYSTKWSYGGNKGLSPVLWMKWIKQWFSIKLATLPKNEWWILFKSTSIRMETHIFLISAGARIELRISDIAWPKQLICHPSLWVFSHRLTKQNMALFRNRALEEGGLGFRIQISNTHTPARSNLVKTM